MSLPISGCLALACRYSQRASRGTQKTFSARYSSRSSGSTPDSPGPPAARLLAASSSASATQRRVLLLERVRDVLEEDEAERHVLVLGRVHVAAHLVGRGPELLLEAEGLLAVALLPTPRHRLPFKSSSTYQSERPRGMPPVGAQRSARFVQSERSGRRSTSDQPAARPPGDGSSASPGLHQQLGLGFASESERWPVSATCWNQISTSAVGRRTLVQPKHCVPSLMQARHKQRPDLLLPWPTTHRRHAD